MAARQVGFVQYLERRGFDVRRGPAAFWWRMFVAVWAEPGFHRFWRVWNPLYGYFLFRLYRLLGGNRRRVVSTVVVFLFSGFVLHDLPFILITGRVQVTVTAAFLFYAVSSLFSQVAERQWSLRSWPRTVHTLCNVGLVIAGLGFGAYVQSHLLSP